MLSVLPRRTILRLLAPAVLFALALPAEAETELEASYGVTVAGITIGRADAKARFTKAGYAVVIHGTTSGVSRLVSDARASLTGIGRYSPTAIAPASFKLDTQEGTLETHVRMSFAGGAVSDLTARPRLPEAPDRIPLFREHLTGVVDPVGAFLIPTAGPGGLRPPDQALRRLATLRYRPDAQGDAPGRGRRRGLSRQCRHLRRPLHPRRRPSQRARGGEIHGGE
jgi:hypothetical protein